MKKCQYYFIIPLMLMANGCEMRYTKCTMPEFDNETYDLPSDEMNNNKLNKLRAAVLGANDGIVSTSSVVMGVAGASNDSRAMMYWATLLRLSASLWVMLFLLL